MAQQPRNNPAPQQTGMTLWTENTGLMVQGAGPEMQKQLENLLSGNSRGLTATRVALDFCSYMNANPKIAAVATQAGVIGCMINAGRYQATFGEAGLYIIPDASSPGGIRTQESRKFQIERSREIKGVFEYRVRRVYTADEPVSIERDDMGEIESFILNNDNFTAKRTIDDLVGVFVTAIFDDSRPRRIFWWARDPDLNRFRDHSAVKSGGMWVTDPEAAYELAAQAGTARKILPDRTVVSGGDVFSGGGSIPADYEDITPVAPEPASSDAAAEELLARGKATAAVTPDPPPAEMQQQPPRPTELPPLPDVLQGWMENNEDTVIQRVILKVLETVP